MRKEAEHHTVILRTQLVTSFTLVMRMVRIRSPRAPFNCRTLSPSWNQRIHTIHCFVRRLMGLYLFDRYVMGS